MNWERVKEVPFTYSVQVVQGLQPTVFYLFVSWHFEIAPFYQLLDLSFWKSKALFKPFIQERIFFQMIQARKNAWFTHCSYSKYKTWDDIWVVF